MERQVAPFGVELPPSFLYVILPYFYTQYYYC